MIFSRDEVAAIRSGKQTATLTPTTSNLKAGSIRRLRRRYTPHDQDGNPLNPITETVCDLIDGDRKPIVITILATTDLNLTDLKQADATACGYKTLTGLKDAWKQRHRNTDTAKLVRFAIGDLRDRDQFLNWSGRPGGDYTTVSARANDRNAPVLTQAQLAPITKAARERDRARSRDPIQRERDQIVKALDNISEILERHPSRDMRRAVRELRHDLAKLDRKLKAA